MLKKLKLVWFFCAGWMIGMISGLLFVGKQIKRLRKEISKFSEFYYTMRQWVHVNQNGHNVADYFKNNGYHEIAIYGLNEIAFTLMNDLSKNGIEVKYCIDRNADKLFSKVKIYKPEEEMPSADIVVVAVVHLFDEIQKDLSNKLECPIISFSEVVWDAG